MVTDLARRSIEDLKQSLLRAVKVQAFEEVIRLGRQIVKQISIDDWQGWYGTRLALASGLLLSEPKRSALIEEARSLYVEILESLPEGDSKERSSTLRNLGYLFEQRLAGRSKENLKTAIGYYEEAASEGLRARDPRDWALTRTATGFVWMHILGDSEDRELAEASALCFSDALAELKERQILDDGDDARDGLQWLIGRFPGVAG